MDLPPIAIDISDPSNPPRTLDKSLFTKTIPLIACVVPAKETAGFLKRFSESVLKLPRTPAVVPNPDDPLMRRVLMSVDIQSFSDIPADILEFAEKNNCRWLLNGERLTLTYDYWPADQVLKAIIPPDLDICASFETVGHIAHVNLVDELFPYRYLIGQVLLDKNQPRLKTVVTKTGNIETKFRTFPMEVIAGEPRFLAELKENDCRFQFDYSTVYWNSRLHSEHERLIRQFKPGQVICDAFAGIGPFAIPAAKKGCRVLANDLNPESYRYLVENSRRNKISSTNLRCYNLDGREFIRQSFEQVQRHFSRGVPDHFIMNLPALALEFLDAFRGAFNYRGQQQQSSLDDNSHNNFMPIIHCHCFTKSETPELDIRNRVEESMGHRLTDSEVVECHYVRKVAPNKDMYCISFRLPRSIAFLQQDENGDDEDGEGRDSNSFAKRKPFDVESESKKPKNLDSPQR